jgi:hypothetical protein
LPNFDVISAFTVLCKALNIPLDFLQQSRLVDTAYAIGEMFGDDEMRLSHALSWISYSMSTWEKSHQIHIPFSRAGIDSLTIEGAFDDEYDSGQSSENMLK